MKCSWIVLVLMLARCQAQHNWQETKEDYDYSLEDMNDMETVNIALVQKIDTDGYTLTFTHSGEIDPCEPTIIQNELVKQVKNVSIYETTFPGTICESVVNENELTNLKTISITFPGALSDVEQGTHTNFLLSCNFVNDTPAIVGEPRWDPFPTFPIVYEVHKPETGPVDVLQYKIDNTGDMSWFTPPGGTPLPQTGYGYWVDYKYGGPFKLCSFDPSTYTEPASTPPVCTEDKDVIEDKITDTLSISSATLSYDYGLDLGPIVVIEATTEHTGKLDVIITYDTEVKSLHQFDNFPNPLIEVPVADYPIAGTINLKLIGLDGANSNLMVETKEHIIKDYDVIGYPISSTSIEVRWNIQKTTSTADKLVEAKTRINTYQIYLGEAQNITMVTCEDSSDHCFGYFTGLTGGTGYKVTVQTWETDAPTNLNKIQSGNIMTLDGTKTDITIKNVEKQMTDDQDLQASLCFNHTTLSHEDSFSHYDVLLINGNGQWQKHQKMIINQVGKANHFCSDPFSIKQEDFDVYDDSKVIVIQRAQDGVSVLATGESPLL